MKNNKFEAALQEGRELAEDFKNNIVREQNATLNVFKELSYQIKKATEGCVVISFDVATRELRASSVKFPTVKAKSIARIGSTDRGYPTNIRIETFSSDPNKEYKTNTIELLETALMEMLKYRRTVEIIQQFQDLKEA